MKYLSLTLFFIIYAFHCISQPTITAFSPTSGFVGTQVIITGTNFNSTPANNFVFFGATKATVSAASTTQLTVSVPAGATFEYIRVTNSITGLTAYSAQSFNTTFICSGAVGASSFAEHKDSTAGAGPSGIAISDLNGDGNPDIVAVNVNSNTFSVFKNTVTCGTYSLATKVDYSTGTTPIMIAISDIDGDGKPDIVITNQGSNNISVFRNTSSGGTISFATKVDFTSGTGPVSVAINDLNGDGKPDIVVANYTSNNVSIFKNTSTIGSISFATNLLYTTGTNPKSVVLGDMNGDGKPDIAVANYNSNNVSVFGNTSTSSIISFAAKVDYAVGTKPLSAAIGDIDGDGKLDITTANSTANSISVLPNSSAGGTISFAAKVDFAVGIYPDCVTIGDINGDGKPDLAVANYNASTISILQNTSASGTISFATKVDFATGSTCREVKISDINLDGKSDLVLSLSSQGKISILRNVIMDCPLTTISSFAPTSGTVGTTVIINGANFNPTPAKNIVFFGATMANVTSASTTQLTVTAPAGSTYEYISVTSLGSNLTAYSKQPFIITFNCAGTIDPSSFATKTDFATGTTPYDVAIGDMDGDGKPDIVVANNGYSNVSIFKNTSTSGNISFNPKVDFAVGQQIFYLYLSDLDGDGRLDIVVSYGSSAHTVILKNTSTGGILSFAMQVNNLPYTESKLSFGDLDGDGKPDLITNLGYGISVYKNTSTYGYISFAFSFTTNLGESINESSIVDLDGDGKPDIAVANYTTNSISIFKNTSSSGNISFSSKVDFAVGTRPNTATIGDIDGDGKPDIVVANYTSNNVSILKNTSTSGTISFATNLNYTTGTLKPYYISLGDIDGDGKPDIIVAFNNSNTFSILKNTSNIGNVTLAPIINYTPGTNPFKIAIGDLNGDGKPDLAYVAQTSNNVSVLKSLVLSGQTMPAAAGIISGNTTVCQGQNAVIYTVPTISNATSYIWSLPNGATGTSTTNSITANYGTSATTGNITVNGNNSCGYGLTSSLAINVTQLPASASTISGATAVCQSQSSVTYTLPTIANATSYIWTLPAGATGTSTTNSITINYGTSAVSGNITAKGTNTCGAGATSTLAITVNPLPTAAGAITGTASVCQGQNSLNYTVPAIANATSYVWTLPNGASGASTTNSISVNYAISAVSGNITVKGINTCGNSTTSTFAVTVNNKPTTPIISMNGPILHSDAPSGNQWYNQNGIINGEISQDYTVPSNGYYYVIVTLNGCNSDSSNKINITNSGIKNAKNENIIKIYPNPVSNELTIEANGKNETINFEIYNSVGQLVFKGSLLNKTVVQTGSFATGVYMIKLDNGKTFEFKKIIKE